MAVYLAPPFKPSLLPGGHLIYRSTQQSVFDFLKFVYSSLNNKKLFRAICLDVSKAFDCINHDVLLFKLSKIGFSPLTITWFKSYLSRTQTVKLNDVTSNPLPNITGIGQGTILKKSVTNHLFKLRKIRKFINQETAVIIYKQTLLPLLDHSGFLLNSCYVSDRNDLQILQNDALRTCYNVKRRDRLSVRQMHKDANLLSLDQRRKIQLLSLMFIHSKNHNVQRQVNRVTIGLVPIKITEIGNGVSGVVSVHVVSLEKTF